MRRAEDSMGINNRELEDVDEDELEDRFETLPPLPERIKVRFRVRDGKVSGEVIQDVYGKTRTKIVFLVRRDRHSQGWRGLSPKDGEELDVIVEHETQEEDPHRGVLFVQRNVPTTKVGGQYCRCTKCRDFTVPAYEYGAPPPSTVPALRALLGTTRWYSVRENTCEKCGTLHDIIWPEK